jgi:CPA1 family monovalent cation:H+ antiporter
MQTFSVVMVLLVAVLLSSFVARAFKLPLPLPLVQIGVGGLVGAISMWRVELDPEVFFLLLLPPLLFLDGWRIPKTGLFRDAGIILELSLGLVAFTVAGMALFIWWLIPTMPLAVAFALAAVLSPTDPVAFAAIAAKAPLPKRLLHILEGEALLNDASGLVFFRFAVAAAMTGAFSVYDAVLTFVYLALGGVAIGAGVTWGIVQVKGWVSRRYGEDPGVQILVSLMMPFVAYLLAEEAHCSGILAAVAAGITMGLSEMRGGVMAVTRIRRSAVWDTMQYTINGFIFVLLGEQFMSILLKTTYGMGDKLHQQAPLLLFYVVAVTLALAALRIVWVWISFQIPRFKRDYAARQRKKPSLALVVAMSLAGVRGAITLAGIMTLPLLLADGTPFPERDLAIFIAAGVIVCSMILATVVLPLVLGKVEAPQEAPASLLLDRARRSAASAAIKQIEEVQHRMAEGRGDADLFTQAAAQVMAYYRQRMASRATDKPDATQRKMEVIERELILTGLRAEREELMRLVRERKLDDDLARKLVRELDLLEARYV